ncbi:phytanoyl-CoA dioxygenase family protein [Pseudoalteromonas arctica]|uniref:Phytanoyl-CoA dioxygenase family protein n=1 Tax=Pseudoalteromonas arctica TaxID=394751 RepID=A0AAP6Y3R9_9GAMM|nr:phytanoyl-CoA dioxygenase family protein [Pseudoalteromonas arctica]NMP03416.1 phytanoyl-CoA dioxygenase family protein [Pseudoalteromonas arctica]
MKNNNLISEFDFNDIDSPEFINTYRQDGIVIVKNAIPRKLITKAEISLSNFFSSVLTKSNVTTCESDTLDELHQMAQQVIGEENARYLLTIGKDLPVFKQIIYSESVIRVIEQLLATQNIQSADDSNVLRIDRPQNDLTNLPWHQDYPYNMLSSNAVTIWAPLLPVHENMGRMKVISPKKEIMAIEYSNKIKSEFHNSRYIKLRNLDTFKNEFEKKSIEVQEVLPGDIVLFDALLLHRSGENTSNKSRWVATARYGSLDDDAVAQRNYFVARAKYPHIFKNYHPEKWFEID